MVKTTDKDTFWNRKKLEKGVTLRDICKSLDIDQATLSHYLTGMKLPSTAWSVKICDYFDVDYVTGAEEFNKAHESWVKEHIGDHKKRSHIRSRKYDLDNLPEGLVATVKESAPAVCVVNSESTAADIGEDKSKAERVLQYLYNKVDYDIFIGVFGILNP